jgi:hypothetical protein
MRTAALLAPDVRTSYLIIDVSFVDMQVDENGIARLLQKAVIRLLTSTKQLPRRQGFAALGKSIKPLLHQATCPKKSRFF